MNKQQTLGYPISGVQWGEVTYRLAAVWQEYGSVFGGVDYSVNKNEPP